MWKVSSSFSELEIARNAFEKSSVALKASSRPFACSARPATRRRSSFWGAAGREHPTTPSPTTIPNRSWRSPPPETSGSAQVRLSHPLFSGPSPRAPVFDFRAHFFHSAPSGNARFRLQTPGQRPRRAKSDFLSVHVTPSMVAACEETLGPLQPSSA